MFLSPLGTIAKDVACRLRVLGLLGQLSYYIRLKELQHIMSRFAVVAC